MELCTGGELFDLLYDQPDCKFNEPQCAKLATKMLGAVNYLHSMVSVFVWTASLFERP